jgi:hypothetical protein
LQTAVAGDLSMNRQELVPGEAAGIGAGFALINRPMGCEPIQGDSIVSLPQQHLASGRFVLAIAVARMGRGFASTITWRNEAEVKRNVVD